MSVFSHSVGYLFILLMVSFAVQKKMFILMGTLDSFKSCGNVVSAPRSTERTRSTEGTCHMEIYLLLLEGQNSRGFLLVA